MVCRCIPPGYILPGYTLSAHTALKRARGWKNYTFGRGVNRGWEGFSGPHKRVKKGDLWQKERITPCIRASLSGNVRKWQKWASQMNCRLFTHPRVIPGLSRYTLVLRPFLLPFNPFSHGFDRFCPFRKVLNPR